jgi:hypothetical protein
MKVMRNTVAIACAAAIWMAAATPAAAADERLAKVKDLYRSAAYDEALAMLDTFSASAAPSDTIEAREYRVFCLVALDRKDDARKAIADLVTADPSYQLSESQASPRVRAVFRDVRQSLLPLLVQHAYADAKAAFDRKDPQAAAGFEQVLTLLRDPDLASTPAMADLVTVASAFRDLSKALERTPAPPTAGPPPVEEIADTTALRPGDVVERTTSADEDGNVVPPVALSQSVPTAQVAEKRVWDGAVAVLIDPTGKVVSARVTESIFPSYDKQLIRAAMSWTYRPALKDGVPTRYMKVIKVHVDTRPECSTQSAGPCRQPGAE